MNPFERVTIGSTGLSVTRLGLGGAPLGGLFESVSHTDAQATVECAYELGIRYFDTAPFYGHGLGEMRLGRALKAHPRDDFVLSTKVGRILMPAIDGDIEDHKYRDVLPMNPIFDFSSGGVHRSFESSLGRLGLDRVDILHLHDPDNYFERALEEAYPTLAELRDAGRIRAIGAGMNQWEMLYDFATSPSARFDCFLLAGRYTLLDQSALQKLLPECERRGIAILLGGPYNSGILATGSAGAGHYNYETVPPEVLDKVRRLEEVAARHEIPLKAAALQFPLAHPAVVCVLAGARSSDEVRDNVAMMSHPIPARFWAELRERGLIAENAPVPGG